ncbi:tRNA (5-methylaminomethyl-2-thiouridine)(34)-methyltransferase MnmD [Persephonella sp.]
MVRKIKTADGTETLFNEEFNEAYHSTKAGAYTESLHKFVLPTKIKEISAKRGEVHILDVGFGLGYNVAVALKEAVKANPDVYLHIVSVEKDTEVINRIKELELPEHLQDVYTDITSGKMENSIYTAEGKNFQLKILFGEGRQVIKNLKGSFDAVFFDPFSPKVNTEMWTVNLFREIKRLLKSRGILATYSASLAVRKGLLEAGFKIGLVEPVGRKSYSTVASLEGELPPLTEKEKNRLKNSPYAVAYEDNKELTLPRETIKKNWEKKVQERILQLQNLS